MRFPVQRLLQARVAIGTLACALLLWAGAAFADPTFPPLTGRVVDNAHILSADAQTRLTAMSMALEQKTKDQLVIVTLPSLQGTTIEQYGYQLGRHWGIGQKGQNNGTLLIVAPNEHDVRIEVGYGLEGTLTDAQSALIVQNVMMPAFRRGDYDGGVLAGAATILQTFGVETKDVQAVISQQAALDAQQQDDNDGGHGGGFGVIIALFLISIVFGRFFWPLLFLGGGGRGGGFGGTGFGGFGGGGGYGGGFGGGGFGGGFSGGGGSFGGGGASGHW